jgi:hypothetical protein
MYRLSPLLVLALLPAVIAAPVPPPPRDEFGATGLLTRADLERVKFDSRPLKDAEKLPVPEMVVEDMIKDIRTGAPKERPKNPYDLAVHVPQPRVRAGEPVPAYFVLRNNRFARLSVDARLSLFGPKPVTWNSCRIDVRDARTGKAVAVLATTGHSFRSRGLNEIPPDGYYCVRGDLGRTDDGTPLPPGEYEVDWRDGALRSAPVSFTILPTDRKRAPARRPAYRFFRITPEHELTDSLSASEPISWPECDIEFTPTEDLAAVLAVGEEVLVPDIHTIPAADGLVEAWVVWKPYRDGDRVVVTLRAVPPHRQVVFEEIPHLYLQIEVPGAGSRKWTRDWGERKLQELLKEGYTTPLSIEAQLPADWREHTPVSGAARVAVLVTAGRFRWPGELVKGLEPLRAARHPDAPPLWSGIVRTDFTELRFPPRVPERDKAAKN